MQALLYTIFGHIAVLHSTIMSWNDSFEHSFTDKELHFIIIGLLGVIMVSVIHPLFLWLVRKNRVMVVSFLYVITMIIVITFAIEIGQGITGTGAMEFSDISYGVTGFLAFFLVFLIIRAIIRSISRLLKRRKYGRNQNRNKYR